MQRHVARDQLFESLLRHLLIVDSIIDGLGYVVIPAYAVYDHSAIRVGERRYGLRHFRQRSTATEGATLLMVQVYALLSLNSDWLL